MEVEFSTVMAEFKSGSLVVTDAGPDFPQARWKEGLVPRLNRLAENGWKATRASLEGNLFIVEIERRQINPATITQYSIFIYQTTKQQSERPPFSYDRQNFQECMQIWNHRGWKELKTGYLLTQDHEEWIVSLLIREWNRSDQTNQWS
jgi:hypothetical protein